tara:strand:- start:4681 stop:5109 length:429 start_codon:yes stop_codon:yes gene_type:complete
MSLSGKSNINPNLWGPYFWQTFHFTAFGYPENPNEEDISAYKNFYIHFMKILPCDKCSISSQEIINVNDLENALKSRETLIRWSYNFHDSVNKKLNKTSPGYETFKQDFQNRDSNFLHIIIVILLLIVLLYISMRYTSGSLP